MRGDVCFPGEGNHARGGQSRTFGVLFAGGENQIHFLRVFGLLMFQGRLEGGRMQAGNEVIHRDEISRLVNQNVDTVPNNLLS